MLLDAAKVKQRFNATDTVTTTWMARCGIPILRVALGIVFVWFGALKLVPGLSPAEDLVRATVPFLPGEVFLPFLGVWEIAIGLGFLTGRALRLAILLLFLLLFLQMPGTLAPAVLLLERVFTLFPYEEWGLDRSRARDRRYRSGGRYVDEARTARLCQASKHPSRMAG